MSRDFKNCLDYGNSEYYELFLKLLRVESGEVLSVTKARINKKLGL